jgi:hypothetical protein
LRFFGATIKPMTRHAALILLMAAPAGLATAQVVQPALKGVVDRVDTLAADTLHGVTSLDQAVTQSVTALAQTRLTRLDSFVHANRGVVEVDDAGQPARAHEVLLLEPDPAALDQAAHAGFTLIEQGDLDGLGIRFARLGTPPGRRLAAAIRDLRRALPGRTVTADQIHFPGGATGAATTAAPATMVPTGGTVGVIDGGVRPNARLFAQAGFAAGAPRPNDHAQAIVSLLAGAGTARIAVADVYGSDPAGGNALAIARALGWMLEQRVRVVSISLVGPANPLLARAVASAQARGISVVGAVGNDGAAAPPAYPASYPGVIAVTGVDRHDRVLFEAGQALHLDYAAPGADMTAIGLDGRARRLRGTSFAAPLVAARLAAFRATEDPAAALRRADREARATGPHIGRGVLCETCRTGI